MGGGGHTYTLGYLHVPAGSDPLVIVPLVAMPLVTMRTMGVRTLPGLFPRHKSARDTTVTVRSLLARPTLCRPKSARETRSILPWPAHGPHMLASSRAASQHGRHIARPTPTMAIRSALVPFNPLLYQLSVSTGPATPPLSQLPFSTGRATPPLSQLFVSTGRATPTLRGVNGALSLAVLARPMSGWGGRRGERPERPDRPARPGKLERPERADDRYGRAGDSSGSEESTGKRGKQAVCVCGHARTHCLSACVCVCV